MFCRCTHRKAVLRDRSQATFHTRSVKRCLWEERCLEKLPSKETLNENRALSAERTGEFLAASRDLHVPTILDLFKACF